MSQVASAKKNWLDQIKADAERITRRRLEDEGFDSHQDKEDALNAAEARAAKAPEAEVVEIKKSK
jgi:hypothetical protein